MEKDDVTQLHESDLDLDEPPALELGAYSQADSILFRLPGLKRFRKTYVREFRDNVKDELAAFNSSPAISEKAKPIIHTRVAQSIEQIEAFEGWWPVWDQMLDEAFLPALAVGIIFSLVSDPIWFRAERGILDLLIVTVIAMVVPFVCVFIFAFLRKKLFGVFYWLLLLLITSVVIVFILIQTNLEWLPQNIHYGLASGLIAGAASLATYFFVNMCVQVLKSLKNSAKVRRYPEEEIIETINYTLALVERPPADWDPAYVKSLVAYELGWLSRRMEREFYQGLSSKLYQSLSSNDQDTNTWLRKRTSGMAAHVRELKQNVLLPKAETRQYLATNLATMLVNAAEGNWGLIESAEPTIIASPATKLLGTLRTGVALLLPLLIIVAVEVVPSNLSGPIKDSILTASIGWGLLNFVAWLDPKFEKTVGDIKSISDIIPREKK